MIPRITITRFSSAQAFTGPSDGGGESMPVSSSIGGCSVGGSSSGSVSGSVGSGCGGGGAGEPICPGGPGVPVVPSESVGSGDSGGSVVPFVPPVPPVPPVAEVANMGIKSAITSVRDCGDNIKLMGFDIDVEEIDFEDSYQVTFRITK